MGTNKDYVVLSPDMFDDNEMSLDEVRYCRCDVVVVHRIYHFSLGSYDQGLEEHQDGLAGVLAGSLPRHVRRVQDPPQGRDVLS